MIRGAVISVADIDLFKRRTELNEAVAKYVTATLSKIQNPLMIVNGEMIVIWVNDAYYRTFQVSTQETVGTRIHRIGTGEWASPELHRRIEDLLSVGPPFRDHKVTHDFGGIGKKQVEVSGSRIQDLVGQAPLVLLSIEGDFSTAMIEGPA